MVDLINNWISLKTAERIIHEHGYDSRVRHEGGRDWLDGRSDPSEDWDEITHIDAEGDILTGQLNAWLGY